MGLKLIFLHSHTGCVDLFLEASFRAVELQEQSRGHGVGQRAEPVARINHHIIQKLWITHISTESENKHREERQNVSVMYPNRPFF